MDISVNLDINKAGQFINEPVTMRAGEADNVIKASIYKDNKPYTDFKTATFNTTKLSGAVIANDPATVNGNVISYSVAPTVTNNAGKLRNSYFLLDGKTSTESFEVAILPGVSVGSDISAYIPGLQEFQDEWKKVNSGMTDKLDGIDKSVDTFLAKVQTEIDDKNSKFTDDQKAQITSAINDLKNQIETSKSDVNAMDNKLAAIKDSVKDFDVPQITADTKEALDKVNGIQVGGRNLYADSLCMTNWIAKNPNDILVPDNDISGNDIKVHTRYHTIYQYVNLNIGEAYTFSVDLKSETSGENNIRLFGNRNEITGDSVINTIVATSLSDEWQRIIYKFISPVSGRIVLRIESDDDLSKVGGSLYMRLFKLERGNVATDWTPAPEDKADKSYVDNIKIGERNYLLDTDTPYTAVGDGTYNQNPGVAYKLSTGNITNLLKIGRTFTFSCDWAVTGDNPSGKFVVQFSNTPWDFGGNPEYISVSDSNTSGHIVRTFNVTTGGLADGILPRLDSLIGTLTLSNADLKIGNMITDHIPAPEDIENKVERLIPSGKLAYAAMVQDADTSAVKAQNAQIAYSLMTGDTTNAK